MKSKNKPIKHAPKRRDFPDGERLRKVILAMFCVGSIILYVIGFSLVFQDESYVEGVLYLLSSTVLVMGIIYAKTKVIDNETSKNENVRNIGFVIMFFGIALNSTAALIMGIVLFMLGIIKNVKANELVPA